MHNPKRKLCSKLNYIWYLPASSLYFSSLKKKPKYHVKPGPITGKCCKRGCSCQRETISFVLAKQTKYTTKARPHSSEPSIYETGNSFEERKAWAKNTALGIPRFLKTNPRKSVSPGSACRNWSSFGQGASIHPELAARLASFILPHSVWFCRHKKM